MCLLLLLMINESIKASLFSLLYLFILCVHNECASSGIEFGKLTLVSLLCFGMFKY